MFIAESVRESYDGFVRSFKDTATKLPKLDFRFRKRSTVTSIFSGNLNTGTPHEISYRSSKRSHRALYHAVRTIYALFNEI